MMTRISRIVIPGCPHHVTQRGNHRQQVFFSYADNEMYLNLLRKYFPQYQVDMAGFSLMPNHVHHVLLPELENSLAKGVGMLHNDFSRWQHIQRNLTGHLWQNRFYSDPLDEIHCWMALRYIELNPVRAGLVKYAWDWPWSSARAHVTGIDDTGLLNMEFWRKRFDKNQWKDFLLEGLDLNDEINKIRQANKTGRPLGSEEFIKKLEKITGRTLLPRKRGPKPGTKVNRPR
jgi:putative transposase